MLIKEALNGREMPGQPEEDGPMPGQVEASPEEQDAYERFVLAGVKAISEEESGSQILQAVQAQADNPSQALADTTSILVMELAGRGEFPKDVVFHGAFEIMSNLGDFANEAGIFEVDENVKGRAGQLLFADLSQKLGIDMTAAAEMAAEVDDETLQRVAQEQSQLVG